MGGGNFSIVSPFVAFDPGAPADSSVIVAPKGESKHLKGRLGPRVSDVTFFNHGGRFGPRVSDVTFFNHGGRLGPHVSDVTFFNHGGRLGPRWFFMVFGWFPWFFKVVSRFFMVFGWFPWFFKVVSWFSWFLVGFHGFRGFQVDFHCH